MIATVTLSLKFDANISGHFQRLFNRLCLRIAEYEFVFLKKESVS